MLNVSYLSLPPCKYAEFSLFFLYYREYLIVRDERMGAVIYITIIIGKL